MSDNIEEKLDKFSALVISGAREKREQIMEQTEKEYKERVDKKETELLQYSDNSTRKNIRELQKNSSEKILHAELDAKKRLILKREEIIEGVMESARAKLSDFTHSPEYGMWLTEKTKKLCSELGEGKKLVTICENDAKYKPAIEALSDDITVEVSDEKGFTGGIRAVNSERRVAADYSFKELLSEQKQKFLRESGLTLD